MTQLNDAAFESFPVIGGALNDKKLEGLKANIVDVQAPQSTRNDAVNSLGLQEGLRGADADIKLAYFQANGATSKEINEAALQFWLVGGLSSPVDLVLARYSALDATEIAAITAFVNGLVADGIWNNITEVYAPCLNATDFLIGMKFMTGVLGGTPVHTPGEYIDFAATPDHWLDPVDFDGFATIEGFMGAYIVWTAADSTGNSDLFGVLVGTDECYMRWRGDDTNDFNAVYNVTSTTPRSASNQRPTGDIVGVGLEGSDVFELQPGGIVVKSTRVQNIVPPGQPMQWHGRNTDGVPGGAPPARYSLMMHSNGLLSSVAQGSVRARSLQFLRDIGVPGVQEL